MWTGISNEFKDNIINKKQIISSSILYNHCGLEFPETRYFSENSLNNRLYNGTGCLPVKTSKDYPDNKLILCDDILTANETTIFLKGFYYGNIYTTYNISLGYIANNGTFVRIHYIPKTTDSVDAQTTVVKSGDYVNSNITILPYNKDVVIALQDSAGNILSNFPYSTTNMYVTYTDFGKQTYSEWSSIIDNKVNNKAIYYLTDKYGNKISLKYLFANIHALMFCFKTYGSTPTESNISNIPTDTRFQFDSSASTYPKYNTYSTWVSSSTFPVGSFIE